ncbi:palmitoleoyl-protein carboxylesterase NOTUM isoform X2 [Bacillus rossius redtenbacheri]|uniref:palmitoleoyl-protein carboxylesterase NOTUM isoform X2 n=1 Tax=Bacillus rossius redtenbacheri TaxID=93214 RepID=UPI002FDD4DAF
MLPGVVQVVLLFRVVAATVSRSQQHLSTEGVASNQVSEYSTPPLSTIQRFMKMLEPRAADEQRVLKRAQLSVANVTCNDGSPAGFYLRRSQTSTKWIIFLEGGWYCYDERSCHNRWMRLRHLMTSKQWADTKTVGGILSANPEENPFWWDANHVFVPYCSSDSWSGSRTRPGGDVRFSFMGAAIVRQVVQDLLPLGLRNATSLLLAGSSAGGTGVIVNLDPVTELLHRQLGLRGIAVRGASDSGWFLDRAPYSRDARLLSPTEAVRRGLELWQGRVSPHCHHRYPAEPWRCYFGYRSYPTLTAPLFVFQWLFDEAQMAADNVGAPVTKQQWDYIHKMGDSLRNSFQNVSAVFAASCISHTVLTKKEWLQVRINEVSLPQALHCWEQQPYQAQLSLMRAGTPERLAVPMLGDEPPAAQSLQRMSYRTNATSAPGSRHDRRRRRRKKHNGNRNKNRPERNRGRKGSRRREQRSVQCQYRHVERCSWPQCNHSCPKLHNPFTGEEMDFIELLKSFGLDMASVANALGIDIHTLNNMDHEELLTLLTQQAN